MFNRILTLIIKEWILLFRDSKTRVILMLPVVVQVVVFPFAATLDVTNATIGILNEDNGHVSTELIHKLDESSIFSKTIMLTSSNQINNLIDNQIASLIVKIPQDFSRNALNNKKMNIQVILDGRNSNSAQIIANSIQEIVYQYQREKLQIGQSDLIIRHWYNPNLNYKWFVLPSLIAMITTIGVLLVTSLSIAREREQGTLDQVLVSPLTTGELFVGKAVPALLVAIMQGSIILFCSILLYRIQFQGEMLLLYGCMIVYTLSLVGFGLLISALCATQQQAFIGIIFFMVPAILLSGYIAPVENMPFWLQEVTWINPVRHFTHIAKQVYLKGADFHIIAPNFYALILIIISTGSLAYFMFKRKMS